MSRFRQLGIIVAAACASTAAYAQRSASATGIWATEGYGLVA